MQDSEQCAQCVNPLCTNLCSNYAHFFSLLVASRPIQCTNLFFAFPFGSLAGFLPNTFVLPIALLYESFPPFAFKVSDAPIISL